MKKTPKGRPIEDALAQVTASLKTLQSECVRVAAMLVRIPAEAVIRNRELIARDTTVAVALELKNASDGMRRPTLFVGAPHWSHTQDPEAGYSARCETREAAIAAGTREIRIEFDTDAGTASVLQVKP